MPVSPGWTLVWLCAWLLGPSASPGESGAGAMAVHWRATAGSEAPDPSLRASVRERLAAVDGRPTSAVLDGALARARVAVSRELEAGIVELQAALRRELDEADLAYREGRFEAAGELLAGALLRLRRHAELPGAAASAREAHLLAALLAWSLGERERAEVALGDALRLDPEAQLSTRRAPPALVARYRALQRTLLAARETAWVTPRLRLPAAEEISVEIDGVVGLRPVPPGEHFVVLWRDGHAPVASWRDLAQPWRPPAGAVRIAGEEPEEAGVLAAICEALELDVLVLAERRRAVVGLEAYGCGRGFGPRWLGRREQLAAGVAAILAGPFDALAPSLADDWPIAPEVATSTSVGGDQTGDSGSERPWYRKGWIWGTSVAVAAVVAGSVTLGVLAAGAGQPGPRLEIDADDFVGR